MTPKAYVFLFNFLLARIRLLPNDVVDTSDSRLKDDIDRPLARNPFRCLRLRENMNRIMWRVLLFQRIMPHQMWRAPCGEFQSRTNTTFLCSCAETAPQHRSHKMS